MFETWLDGVVFGVLATFFTGVITSIIAKAGLKNLKINNSSNA